MGGGPDRRRSASAAKAGARPRSRSRSTSPSSGKAAYTLRYRYAPGDTAISWDTKEARGAVRDIRGEYLLDEVETRRTKVTYRLAVELGVLVPGFLRTEGAKRVIENALERLKRRVEMG